MKNLFKALAIVMTGYFLLTAESCDQPTAAMRESVEQNAAVAESNMAVPFPSTPNWTEKKQLATIIEKRDTPHLSTYTYLVGMNNQHTPLCRSEGYGHPETEQFTNPMVTVTGNISGAFTTIPQADPNGLYSSPSASGTWVLCLFKDGKVEPVRSEPNVITLTHPWDQLMQDGM